MVFRGDLDSMKLGWAVTLLRIPRDTSLDGGAHGGGTPPQ